MRRLQLSALLILLTTLSGCGELESSPSSAANIPTPPVPEPRRLEVDLKRVASASMSRADHEAGVAKSNGAGGSSTEKSPLLLGKPLEERTAGAKGEEMLKLFGPTFDRQEFAWSEYRGRAVLVMFWASWCPGCRDFLPQLEKLTNYVRSRNFTVVTVNIDRDPAAARAYLDTISLPFETIMDGEQQMALDQEYPTTAVPTLVIVNKAGMITDLSIKAPDFIEQIKKLAAEPYSGPIARKSSASSNGKAGVKTSGANDVTDEEALVEAKAGAGKKGRGYGGDIYTEPLKARWTTEQKLVFDIQIPKAMQLFQATNDRFPASQDEFMTEIVEKSGIQLPELPAGNTYVYLPEKGKLMIREAKK